MFKHTLKNYLSAENNEFIVMKNIVTFGDHPSDSPLGSLCNPLLFLLFLHPVECGKGTLASLVFAKIVNAR